MLPSIGAFAGTFDPYEGRQEKNRIYDFSEEVALYYEMMGQTISIPRLLVRGYKEINLKALVEVVSGLPSLSLDYHNVDGHSAVNQTGPANFTCRMAKSAANTWIPVSEALKIALKWGDTKLDADALARIVYQTWKTMFLSPERTKMSSKSGLESIQCSRKVYSKWSSLKAEQTLEELEPRGYYGKKWHTALVDAHGAADVLERLLNDLEGQL